jgi:hypothetical protein
MRDETVMLGLAQAVIRDDLSARVPIRQVGGLTHGSTIGRSYYGRTDDAPIGRRAACRDGDPVRKYGEHFNTSNVDHSVRSSEAVSTSRAISST